MKFKNLVLIVILSSIAFIQQSALAFDYSASGYLPPVSPQDISGTITEGGVAQTISPASKNRRGYWIMNLSSESIWLSDIEVAVQTKPALEIKPGMLYESVYGGTSQNALSIIGPTTGQIFSGREW